MINKKLTFRPKIDGLREMAVGFLFSITLKITIWGYNSFQVLFNDWFNNNFNVWKKFLLDIPNFEYLEIGTFEGRSALFVSEFNCKKIVCVDPYIEYKETEQFNFKMSDVFESVNEKLKKITDKDIKFIREKSDDFFLKTMINLMLFILMDIINTIM